MPDAGSGTAMHASSGNQADSTQMPSWVPNSELDTAMHAAAFPASWLFPKAMTGAWYPLVLR